MPKWKDKRCISFDSYIKPQLWHFHFVEANSCISFDSYIKPQLIENRRPQTIGCISFDSYIKPQLVSVSYHFLVVVYLLIPTSNHNGGISRNNYLRLYIFWFLHQTTTAFAVRTQKVMLYIFWFLHQTTTDEWKWFMKGTLYIFWFLHQTTTAPWMVTQAAGCISFDSYIKPQHTIILLYHY